MMHLCKLSWISGAIHPYPPFPQGVATFWEKELVLSPPFLVMQQNPPQLWLIQLGFKILPRAAVCIISLLCINCENSKSVSYMLALIFYHFRRDLPKHWTAISDKRDHHNVTSMPLWLCPPPLSVESRVWRPGLRCCHRCIGGDEESAWLIICSWPHIKLRVCQNSSTKG